MKRFLTFVCVAGIAVCGTLLFSAGDKPLDQPRSSKDTDARYTTAQKVIASLEFRAPPPSPDVRRIYFKKCALCHSIQGVDSDWGIPLNQTGSKRSIAWLKAQIRDPETNGSDMPSFPKSAINDRDLARLVGYLSHLRKRQEIESTRFTAKDISHPERIMSELTYRNDPLTRYLREYHGAQWKHLERKKDTEVPVEESMIHLTHILNKSLFDLDLSKPEYLISASLSEGTSKLIEHRACYALW
jgi:hypothetical protein